MRLVPSCSCLFCFVFFLLLLALHLFPFLLFGRGLAHQAGLVFSARHVTRRASYVAVLHHIVSHDMI